ncbi:DNA-deoxyinosine glycosylase [Paenibacillus sp. LHD-117]|uniref:DNA-deoxyinosine glycosylase n=1 Tax=Paenibacillus sp. LHD-117 TaxID=3071412 RepID=UPI0027E115E9|nr:DNA-deoxyinosine glycosylase [Paenibacillus sp. LHD-117]MDQ6420245.1 DNA-deoxyinosine glycosylase [Paenibacillus sp. LHD-117]
MVERIFSFPPVVDERARVLIAGTAPSVKSLEHGQFYGHPQNYFWRVVYALFGDEGTRAIAPDGERGIAGHAAGDVRPYLAPNSDYGERLDFLQAHRLALWDVIFSCEREGSLDVNIKAELPNDIPGLLERYPGIRCIAFNGSKAFDTFRKHYGKGTSALPREVALLKLPSTSPIPTKHMRSLEDRVAAWRAIVPYAAGEV